VQAQGAPAPLPSTSATGGSAELPSAPPPPGWRLTFDDEFSGTALDGSKWNPGHWSSGNDFYAPSNVLVDGGLLRLRAASASSSAMVQTLGKLALRSGRIEVAARIPSGQGFWPALWLRPVDLRKAYPELDMLEMWMTDEPADPFDGHVAWFTYHWPGAQGDNRQTQGTYRSPDDFTAGFHLFAVEWEPGEARWYVDGVQRWRVTGAIVDATPVFLILSLQIGGAWWIGSNGEPNANTPFPSELQVDYVRVYQRAS
jgi:beta-glucanase (GH16 family)